MELGWLGNEVHALPFAYDLGIVVEGQIDLVPASDGHGELHSSQRALQLAMADVFHDKRAAGLWDRAVAAFEIAQPAVADLVRRGAVPLNGDRYLQVVISGAGFPQFASDLIPDGLDNHLVRSWPRALRPGSPPRNCQNHTGHDGRNRHRDADEEPTRKARRAVCGLASCLGLSLPGGRSRNRFHTGL